MIGTAVQLLAGFLAHSTLGVNAMAAGLPRFAFTAPGDTPIERDAPPTVSIYNDVDHKGLTFENGYQPPGFPALLVLRDTREVAGPTKPETPRTPAPRTVGLVLAYVTDDKADQRTAQAACEMILRAAERSLRRYKQQGNAEGYRELNGIRVLDVPRWTRVEETAALDAVRFWGWIDVDLTVVDGIA